MYFLVMIISYLIGSFSSAYFLVRILSGTDVREYGSGNAGSTNVLRVLGKKAALMTFIMDALKGVIAVALSRRLLGVNGGLLGAVFVVIGHNYPVFLKFKGGKGIATSIGILFILNWKVGIACVIVGITSVVITRYVSLGSLMGTVTAPIFFYIFDDFSGNLRLAILILVILSIYGHRSNIDRLIRGIENKI